MKVCVITCYNQPDYVRAKVLRAAIAQNNKHELLVIKNTHKGIIRYIEVLLRILTVRLKLRPDLYILTFRGYEMLLPVRLLTLGKPLIFDEFINLIEWMVYEHKKIRKGSFVEKIIGSVYTALLNSVQCILMDTKAHAAISSELSFVDKSKYAVVYVGTDESTFFQKTKKTTQHTMGLNVLYYGNMLPLHGIETVLKTAVLARNDDIHFTLIGGKPRLEQSVNEAVRQGAHITYRQWVAYDTLPGFINDADVCLAGPFGGTYQAQFVITGKAYQYLAMEKPVVIGENKESTLFADKQNALIVEQSNAGSLYSSLLWAKEHKPELTTIAAAGRKLYEDTFSSKQVEDTVDRIIEKMTSGVE